MSLDLFKNEKFDIIIVAGQSNSEGYGLGEVSEEFIPSDKILCLSDNSRPRFEKTESGQDVFCIDYPSDVNISVADEPLTADGTQKIGRFYLSFAKSYIENGLLKEGRKILVLCCGVGGTGFRGTQWGLDGTLYKRVKDFARLALNLNDENRLVGFLWHQGECDSFENPSWDSEKRYLTHKANLEDMVLDFKNEFAIPTLPFIAGGFVDEWYFKFKEPCDGVLKAIKEVFGRNGGFVETHGLKSNNEQVQNGDDIHFCRDALRILGEKYFEKYLKYLKQS